MSIDFNQAFGGGGGYKLGVWQHNVLTTKLFPAFTEAGTIEVAGMGGGGAGGRGSSASDTATGGNSAPIGVVQIPVAAGDQLEVVIGLGGATTTVGGNGNKGTATLVKINGVTIMTCPPGEPGLHNSLTSSPAVAAVTGADRWWHGLRAGGCTPGSGRASGGAAVDIFNSGLGVTLDATSNGSVGGSVGVNNPLSTVLAPPPLVSPEFGVIFLGLTTAGLAGVGAIGGNDGGMFAGGGAGLVAGRGGRGAGGGGSGANSTSGGAGGDGYARVTFVPR